LTGFPQENFIGKEIWTVDFFKNNIINKKKFIELSQTKSFTSVYKDIETASKKRINIEFISSVYFVGEQKNIQFYIHEIKE
jgi:two-component system CheB/CheR fusion protein